MSKTPIVIIDLETTGLDILTVDPVELAMLHVEVRGDDIVEVAHFDALVPCPPIYQYRCIVEQRAIEWIDDVVRPTNRTGGVLSCGNNIGRFDLPIVRRTMPRLAERFFYRVLDISAIKVARSALGWGDEPPKIKTHRALEDCRASLAELRYYHAEQRRLARRGDTRGDLVAPDVADVREMGP